VNSGEWSGKLSEVATLEMAAYAKARGFGEAAVTFRIRDWGISGNVSGARPCDDLLQNCGTVPVPYDQLPVVLPETAAFTGTGESPLGRVPEFVSTTARSVTDQRAAKPTPWIRLLIRSLVFLSLLRSAQ